MALIQAQLLCWYLNTGIIHVMYLRSLQILLYHAKFYHIPQVYLPSFVHIPTYMIVLYHIHLHMTDVPSCSVHRPPLESYLDHVDVCKCMFTFNAYFP